MKHTPSSLGWTHGTELLNRYTFRVPPWGRQPYFELAGKWTPTHESPVRVYLDEPKQFIKGQFPCMYPGCNGKQTVFSRPADLERHYKNVHADDKETLPCDYLNCPRSNMQGSPFTRKDHYRDHLRDYHKEDIGSPKAPKYPANNSRNNSKWHAAQKKWLAGRRIDPKNWRCGACLGKNDVAQVGWACPSCRRPCEEERIKTRGGFNKEKSDNHASETREHLTASHTDRDCKTCNGAESLDVDEYGAAIPCPSCQ
ncbi:hypothetical protein N431DRAFT_284563, partial [Stipitochalara longipes BDJ]